MTGVDAMSKLVWEGTERMSLRERPVPAAGPGEALVRVAAVGICGSELEGYLGRMSNRAPPLVMGHEFSGTCRMRRHLRHRRLPGRRWHHRRALG
jgi:threonine dehydrogenase-like Zn-dependent dehydrogenase